MPAQTIFVRSLPATATNERLEEIFSEIGPIKQCFVVRDKGSEKCRGFGYVTYSMDEDAQRALKEVKEYDGQRLFLSVAKKKLRDKKKAAPEKEPVEKNKGLRKNKLKARLIIRNLSFKCSENDLREAFIKFGTVIEASIPLKADGKMRGFAFVMFKNVSEASKALSAMNMKEIKGRPVAVDWAVPKDKFVATQPPSSAGDKKAEEKNAKERDSESDSEHEQDKKEQETTENKKLGSKAAVQQEDESQSEDDSEEQDSEEEDSNDEDEDDDDDDDGEDEKEEDGEDDEEKSDFDSEESGLEDDDSDSNDDDEELEEKKKKSSKKPLPSDIQEGKTIFIRNLSFDTEEEGLEEVLLQYGELNYIKICLHPDTEHSKGCAFAQFKMKEAAERCIAVAQDEAENGGIRVDGRKLLIVAAVTREEATKLKENKKKVETGTRNLYLAREGLIRAGTKAAEGVPETDMAKRQRFEEVKRAKLRDIHVFVSKTRLCVHNLPKSVDSKRLRALCLQGLKGTKGVNITECRVMYDKKPEKGRTMGQSLGYGFVQFREHEHALSTLRYLNNNPDIFGSHKRPIVEFSLEDSRKLKIKEARNQKNKEFVQNRQIKGGGKQTTAGAVKKGETQRPSSSGHTGKEKAPFQKQKQGRYYSGFQTKPEVEHVDLQNGKKRKKVLPFPSHRGPKVRMRDKGKQGPPPPKKPRPGPSRKDWKRRQIEKPTQPRNQKVKAAKQFKRKDGDRFDNLVEQYKKKLMGNNNKTINAKRNKWFES